MKALHERNRTNIDVSSLHNRFNNYRDVIKIKTRHLYWWSATPNPQCSGPSLVSHSGAFLQPSLLRVRRSLSDRVIRGRHSPPLT